MMRLSPRRRRRTRRMDASDGFRSASQERLVRSNFSFYIFAFLAMTFLQAGVMLLVGFFSKSLHDGSLFGPMDVFMMSHLWITHEHVHLNGRRRGRYSDSQEADDSYEDEEQEIPEFFDERPGHNAAHEVSKHFTSADSSEIFDLMQVMQKNDTRALDDYYRRPHIVPTRASADVPPILIVGGSDGSGTRAFVDVVRKLGVPMLVDDKGTLDVHAPIMFKKNGENDRGWPPLVKMILEQTHSADYDLESLPESVRTEALGELQKFQHSYAPSVRYMLDGINKDENVTAANVEYGFKAPVSMLLLPLLLETFGRVKFLHVVRDGRDVSFSRNTSPVSKFYNPFYRDPYEKMQKIKSSGIASQDVPVAQAMQLWNDWNSQVSDWARRNADGKTFDYLVMRTEDLLSPATKFESLAKLADFVGSSLSVNEVCCLSREELVDMGVSVSGGKNRLRGHHIRHGRHREAVNVDLDDPNEISMADVALESQRKMLDMALEKRPELFKRIQAARQQNEARLRRHTDVKFGQMKNRALDQGNARIRERPLRDYGRTPRRLSEEFDPIDKAAYRDILKNHHPRRDPETQRQEPDRVLQRYGKWKSALEGKAELSRLLHADGGHALQVFGYQPLSRFADLPPDRELVCNAQCSVR